LELFDIYDVDQSGELDYKEFVSSVFSSSGKGGQSRPEYQEEVKKGSAGKSKKAYLQVEG
jgi:hypothetical protein